MKFRVAALLSFFVPFLTTVWLSGALTEAAAPAPSPYQPNADIYEIAGYPSPTLQTLNPITTRLKAGSRTVRYRYFVMSGCADGNMRSTLATALSSTSKVTGISFVEDASAPDITIRANCGVSFSNICGSNGAIACLGRGWPYVNDIDVVTTMATFYDLSQVSIWEHELAGHALATWAEGYLLNGSFGNAPNFVSFMNTGPLSRYDWPENDVNRWWRTMWIPLTVSPPCTGDPCYDGTRWKFSSGWSVDPVADVWYDPKGRAYWGPRQFWGGRCNLLDGICHQAGEAFYDEDLGNPWLVTP